MTAPSKLFAVSRGIEIAISLVPTLRTPMHLIVQRFWCLGWLSTSTAPVRRILGREPASPHSSFRRLRCRIVKNWPQPTSSVDFASHHSLTLIIVALFTLLFVLVTLDCAFWVENMTSTQQKMFDGCNNGLWLGFGAMIGLLGGKLTH